MKKGIICVLVCMLVTVGMMLPVSGTFMVERTSYPSIHVKDIHTETTNAANMTYFDMSEIAELGQAAWGVTTADFNTDGQMDFAVGSATSPFYHSTISMFYNDGTGGFTKQDKYTYTEYIDSLASGDFNNDGAIDLLFGYSGSTPEGRAAYGNVSILFNDGNNNFGNATLIITRGEDSPGPFGRINPKISTADYDLDGDLDLVLGDNSGQIELFYNDGIGNFTSAGIIHDWGHTSWGVASADFDGDGNVDFLVSAEGNGLPYRSDIYLKLNQKTQNNTAPPFDSGRGEPIAYPTILSGSLASLDYDNDGDMDFVAAEMSILRLYIYDQGTYFPCYIGVLPDYEDLTFGAIASADFNNDGYDDFVAGGTQGIVRVFISTNGHPFGAVLIKPLLRHITINDKSIPFPLLKRTLVFGKITLEAKTLGEVTEVEFFISMQLNHGDVTPPYEWVWDEHSTGKYTVQIIASDGSGHSNMVMINDFWKLQR